MQRKNKNSYQLFCLFKGLLRLSGWYLGSKLLARYLRSRFLRWSSSMLPFITSGLNATIKKARKNFIAKVNAYWIVNPTYFNVVFITGVL
jgi:hypothetical protein